MQIVRGIQDRGDIDAPARFRPRRAPARLVVLACLVALLALLPLFFVIGQAVHVAGGELYDLVFRPRVAELLANTVRMVVVSTLLCGALGTGAAWLVERTDLPGRRVWAALLAAPLAVPAFVNSYGWVSITPAVEGYLGAVLIVSLSYFPLVFLPVAAALRGMDPALEEAARALGHGPWRTFFRAVLPQLRPALGGGMLIVALHELAEFGAFSMLRFETFTTAIYSEYQSSFDGPAANSLAAILVVLCLLLLLAELRLRGRGRFSRVGSGSARPAHQARLGKAAPLAVASVVLLLILALGVPLGSLTRWLLIGTSAAFPLGDLVSATATSLGLGLAAAVVTTLLALPVALLVERHRSRLAVVLERSTYIAHALPGIVIALALVFVAIHFLRPLYQSAPLLVLGYTILFLPMAMVGVRSALAQAAPALTDAARVLGNGPLTALRRVTLPIIAPGLGAAGALVFLMVATELTTTLLLAPIGTHTLATEVWSATGSLSYAAAAPYAALMVFISIPAVYLLTRSGRKAEIV
ncbi:MAG: iron ABC transporter permease [Microbacteriaceae bacterium]